MNIKKRGFLFFILIVFAAGYVYADNINVDPAFVRFDNVLRGGYASSDIYITTDSKTDLKVNYVVVGELSGWVTIENKGGAFLNSNSPYVLSVSIRVPEGVSNGEHQGSMVFSFEDTTSSKITSGGARDFVVPLGVYVTDQVVSDVKIANVNVDDVLLGEEVFVVFDIKNDGNTNVRPTLNIDIKDVGGKLIKNLNFATQDEVLSTQQKTLRVGMGSLDYGDYNAQINFFLGDFLLKSVQTPFSVVQDSLQIRKITFVELESRDKGHVDNDFNLVAHIKNSGEDTTARFSGELYFNGEFISDLASDFMLVRSNEEAQIKFGFVPTKVGFYKIVGRLETPNLVRTNDKESAFEIVPEDVGLEQVPLSSNPLLAILLMLLAIYIFVRINKMRSKQKRSKKRR